EKNSARGSGHPPPPAPPRPPPPHPPQLLALLGRQPVALARVHRRLPDPAAHRRLTQVELATDRRQRPLAPAHQGDDLTLEFRRERPPRPSACPVPFLRLLPNLDSLHVGSRPHLGCPPVGGKSKPIVARERHTNRSAVARSE